MTSSNNASTAAWASNVVDVHERGGVAARVQNFVPKLMGRIKVHE
jgi:hypothetical protein